MMQFARLRAKTLTFNVFDFDFVDEKNNLVHINKKIYVVALFNLGSHFIVAFRFLAYRPQILSSQKMTF